MRRWILPLEVLPKVGLRASKPSSGLRTVNVTFWII